MAMFKILFNINWIKDEFITYVVCVLIKSSASLFPQNYNVHKNVLRIVIHIIIYKQCLRYILSSLKDIYGNQCNFPKLSVNNIDKLGIHWNLIIALLVSHDTWPSSMVFSALVIFQEKFIFCLSTVNPRNCGKWN